MQENIDNITKPDERNWKKKRQFNYISSQTLKGNHFSQKKMDISTEYLNEFGYESDIGNFCATKENSRASE